MNTVALLLFGIKQLSPIHAAYSRCRDEGDLIQLVTCKTSLFQGFTQGKPAHQCSTCQKRIMRYTQHLHHLLIAELNLTYRKILMNRPSSPRSSKRTVTVA